MKSFTCLDDFFRITCNKKTIALSIVATISLLSIPPAFAEHGHEHGGGGWRGHHEWRGYGGGYGYPQPYYGYSQPVYAPPTVYYPPQPSPGISVILPLNFRIR